MGSGSPLKRPDQRFAIGYFTTAALGTGAAEGSTVFALAPCVVCCGLDRKSPDLDESLRSGVIEGVAFVVRRQSVIVQRKPRFPPDDAAITLVELEPDRARHSRLDVLHERVDRRSHW